jgi:hypothetical protein
MSKYINYCEFLKEFFNIKTTFEEFTKDKKIIFVCKAKSHVNSLSVASFGNKKYKMEAKDFCQICKDEQENINKTEIFKKEIKEKSGHNIISVNFSTKKVEYKCGNCDNLSSTFISNLQREERSNNCPKCQNDKFKIHYREIKNRVEKQGMKLLTEEKEYENNKQKLKVVCICGNDKYEAVLFDINRGKKCSENCKVKKCEETCIERYGVRNVSQNPLIFEKIFKSLVSRKLYKFLSGKKIFVQGWEPYAIDYLLEDFSEDDLYFGKDIPRIRYNYKNKDHIYFPDIYIKSIDTIVEVKSNYTYNIDLEKNYAKFNSTLICYNLKVMIYDNKLNLRYFNFFKGEEIPLNLLS